MRPLRKGNKTYLYHVLFLGHEFLQMEMVQLAPARPLPAHSHLHLSRWQSQLEGLELLRVLESLESLEFLEPLEPLGCLVPLEPLVD